MVIGEKEIFYLEVGCYISLLKAENINMKKSCLCIVLLKFKNSREIMVTTTIIYKYLI